MRKTKKQPVKRKYTKKSDKWKKNIDLKNSETDFKQAIDEFKVTDPKAELDEIEFLDAIVTSMEQLLPEQKSRIINYLYSRYWMYITLSKLTQ